MKRIAKHFFQITALALGLSMGPAALAQDTSKPITLVAYQGPGSGVDVVTRLVADALSKELGQTVVVENRPGVDGMLAAQSVARAKPDGLRLGLMGTGQFYLGPATRKEQLYNPMTDFTPIGGVINSSLFMYANKDMPARNFKEFVDYAKKSPGKLSHATASITGLLLSGVLEQAVGINTLTVPYQSQPAAIVDLISGQVSYVIGSAEVLPMVKDGKVNAIAYLNAQNIRSPLMPDVPTFQELGITLPFGAGWFALVGPSDMPPAMVQRLNKAWNAGMARPEVRERLTTMAFSHQAMSQAEFADYFKSLKAVYDKAVKDMNIPIN